MGSLEAATLHQRSGIGTLIAILLAVVTTTAAADAGGQNDAGSGGDAGNTRSLATAVALGASYVNNKLRVGDVDWFAADAAGTGASCIRARVTANAPMYAALGAESSSLRLSAPFVAEAGRETSGGIAGVTPLTATLRTAQVVAEGTTKYNFTLERLDLPLAGGDGGVPSDAGESPSTATPVSPGCIGGTLSGLDIRDTFSVVAAEGDVITYTLASTASSVRATLLDAVGNALGPSIAPGESASLRMASPGTYFLSSAQTSSISGSSYAIGVMAGPEPSSCRPYCLD